MAVTRIQRSSTSDQTVETNARGHTEKNTSKNADATPSKTQFDNPVAKAELVKGNQGGTQSSTAAGQTNVYNNEQATRNQLDVKAPGEEQAQFKGDHYNPSSTITRSKESDTNQGQSRDESVWRERLDLPQGRGLEECDLEACVPKDLCTLGEGPVCPEVLVGIGVAQPGYVMRHEQAAHGGPR